MLEIRPYCEHCGKHLGANSTEAMICSFECTYCADCVALFENVCPSCGGNFQPRPIRPKVMVAKYPVSVKRIVDPKSAERIQRMKNNYKSKAPEER